VAGRRVRRQTVRETSTKRDLARLTDLVYEAAADAQTWPSAMTEIADVLRASAMSLTVIAGAIGKPRPFVVAPRNDPAWTAIYLDRWAAQNLVRERGLGLPVGVPYRFEDLMPRAAFERTPFYNEWFAPQRQNLGLFMNLVKNGRTVSGIGFYRSRAEGGFGRNEEALLQALGPHLTRAVALNLRLARIGMERSASAEMLNCLEQGVLLVDAQARVLFANRAAEVLLREGSGLRMQDGCLAAATPAKSAALRRLIAGDGVDAGAGLLALPRVDGLPMAAQVLSLKAETTWLPQAPAAIVFVTDPRAAPLPSQKEIQLLFDLTAAQTAVASELLNGAGVQAVARRLGISASTVRTHLLEIYQKTGTHRQADLVRLILQRRIAAVRVPPGTE